jgi:CcmD family protein
MNVNARIRMLRIIVLGIALLSAPALAAAAAQQQPAQSQPPASTPAPTPAPSAQPPATAKPAPPRAAQDEFVPVEDLPDSEKLPAAPFLIAAYTIVWLVLLMYVWSLWRRLTQVERELKQAVESALRD